MGPGPYGFIPWFFVGATSQVAFFGSAGPGWDPAPTDLFHGFSQGRPLMVAFSVLPGRDVIWYLRIYFVVFRRGDLPWSPFSILPARDVIWYLRLYLTVFRRGDLPRSPFWILPGRGGTRPLRIYSMVFRRGDLPRSPFSILPG